MPLARTVYRLVLTNPPTAWDSLSQAARRQPCPVETPEFRQAWAGLSMFDSFTMVWRIGKARNWRIGEFIAELMIEDEAPITYRGPDRKGHWLLYDAHGRMVLEDGADFLRACVVRVVHGVSPE